MKRVIGLSAAAALLVYAGAASAAPTTFFGEDTNNAQPATNHPNANTARTNFFSNLSGVGTETFESFATGAMPPLAVVFPGAGTATLTGTGTILDAPTATNQFAISGTKFLQTDGTFGLTFSSAISAFGFYGTDIGDVGAQLTLTLVGSNGTTTLVVPNQLGNGGGSVQDGNVLYFGFFDTTNTYTSISFAGAGSDVFGFDDFSIGVRAQVTPSVPEPASWAMMIAGFGAVGTALRRRRAAHASFA